jgi:DNA repair protein SbcC/Rad50
MIKTLTYSVTFPTNGVTLSGELVFQPGLTAITGDNGAGKSFGSIEMVRYMLFGKRALRGPASDYKTLTAKAEVVIAGLDYVIERTPKGESLKDASGDVLAVGTDAVNIRLGKLLGMSLEVFDVVCAAVQKESDRLSKLQPAARKRLIDETVGLTSNESAEKDCKTEATGLLREAEALEKNLVVPTDPVVPDAYRPSDVIGQELADLTKLRDQRRDLHRILDQVGPEPVAPTEAEADIKALEDHESARREVAAQVASAEQQLKALPEASYSEAELNAAELDRIYREALAARGPEPAYTVHEIAAWEAFYVREEVAKQLGEVEVECPSCTMAFKPGHTMQVAMPNSSLIPSPTELRQARSAQEKWAVPLPTQGGGDLELSAEDIRKGRAALERAEERKALLATTWLTIPEDCSAELRTAMLVRASWEAYRKAKDAWTLKNIEATRAETALALLPEVEESSLTKLNNDFVTARIYETQLENFMKASETYRVGLEQIEDRRRRAEDFKLGAKKLAQTRQKFKNHLAPTLSTIASSLIDEMTGGALSSVIVDGDMNITVNGQDIGTLSGAGSTAANLALRLALGQVLVRGTLPIFLADEPDSDMRAERAAFTMECLANLKGKLQQVLVITHKSVEFTDQVITFTA